MLSEETKKPKSNLDTFGSGDLLGDNEVRDLLGQRAIDQNENRLTLRG
jgi:hypothetical protein